MIIYVVGMACVGKTTIGRMLAERLGYTFFDLEEKGKALPFSSKVKSTKGKVA